MTQTKHVTRAIGALVMVFILIVSGAATATALYGPVTHGDVDPVANPDFPQLCGANVMLVLDNSASLNAENLTDVKNAANNTVDVLAGTNAISGVGVISFNQELDGSDGADTRIAITSLDGGSDVQNVKNAIGGIDLPEAETLTNWEAALLEASLSENDQDGDVADENVNKPADIVILVSDGRPNSYGYPGLNGTGATDSLEAATLASNVVKGEDTRVIGVGFPDSSGNVPSATPFEAITGGASSISGDADDQVNDYYIVSDSSELNAVLTGIASEFDCGISVEKLNDANNDSTFTDDETAPAPGDAVTYEVTVSNTGSIDITIDSYADDQYGVPALNEPFVGETLPAGGSIVVTFEGTAPGENGVKVNTFNVTAVDENDYALDDEDDTTVRSPDLTPSIDVQKWNDGNADGTYSDDETSALPGDSVTYLVTVTNDGPNTVTIDSFSDDVYTGLTDGDLNQSLVGAALAPGESISVTFQGSTPSEEDTAKTNTFNLSASDGDGDVASDEDDTTVRSPDLTPSITVEKQNDADADGTYSDDETSDMPGDSVTYLVTVTNDGPNTVTIDSFSDDTYSLVDGDFNQSLVGAVLASGESITVTFEGSTPSAEDTAKTNIFTVTASDADGDQATDSDPTTVRSPDLTPVITVEKLNDASGDGVFTDDETADLPGDSVTYQVNVTNVGPNTVTIQSFSDDTYSLSDGDLSQALTGAVLAPGDSIVVTFEGTAPDAENASKVNVFTVNASDADGDVASDEDDTTVRSPDLIPSIVVEKLVDANGDGTFSDSETASSVGGTVTYQVTVTNDGPNDVNLTSYSDDKYGTPTLNQSLIGVVLAPGESLVVTFEGTAPAEEEALKTNVFTVTGVDPNGDQVSDTDDATVIAPDLTPEISVEKLNDANADSTYTDDETSVLPGDSVTYQVTVTNDGPNTVTIDSFSDDTYTLSDGNLNQPLVGVSLASGESIVVTFVGSAPSDEDQAKVNTFNVSASDADGDVASDEDDTTVRSPDLTPSISVSKLNDANNDGTFTDDETSASPGDSVTYQVTVTNDGPNNVTIDSWSDDMYPSASLSSMLVGVELAPGDAVTVTFEGSTPSTEDTAKTNIFTVTASDGDGDQATDSDPTTVRSPDLTPSISVEKLVDAQGDGSFADSEEATNPGDDVTYRVIVTNDGPNNVTIDSYSDDIYGMPTLDQSLVGVVLAPGESIVVEFNGTAPETYGDSKTNTFTVTASDNDGDTATDSDTATVTTPPALDICPRTPGFWSTHNGEYATGNNMDFTTGLMPVTLGDGTGKSVVVDSDDVAHAIFESELTADSHKSNGVSKLYIHLLAAKFNTANGAVAPQEVLDAIERSDEILTDYDESDWDDVKKNDKDLAQEIEDLKDTLDAFNNRAYTGEDCIEDWWHEEVTE